ncbi:MAG: F0F1 ATP synthase subunit delta [Pseudonocardiaceae bacterium]
MRPASRASLAAARERLDDLADGGASTAELSTLGSELSAAARLLDAERVLRRHLADASSSELARTGLVDSLLGSKAGRATLDILHVLVSSRWSRPLDLVDALEELAWQAVLAEAERDGSIEEVEDELFRFGRTLAAEPKLASLLADEAAPADRRVELLGTVLAGKVRPVTQRLLEQAVRAPRERRLDDLVEQLVERTAARRDRHVAHVTAPGPLSEEQERRLAEALGRIYRRPVSLQVELDPDLLGGLVVRMGDEVIDGSVSGQLTRARLWMPR